jgi:hypothetical protein
MVCYVTSFYEYTETSGRREGGIARGGIKCFVKGMCVGTKLKVMKDLCLHSANSTAHIQLKGRFIWKMVIQVA